MDAKLASLHMGTPNEGVPHGDDNFNWAYRPYIQQGIDLTDQGLPFWYKGTRHPVWNRALAWFTIYREAGSLPSRNSRVEVKDISLWVKSKATGQWTLLNNSATPKGNDYLEGSQSTKPWLSKIEAEGISLRPERNYYAHGWGSMVTIDNYKDVAGVYAEISHRVIIDNVWDVDSRFIDKWLVNVGVDFRPPVPATEVTNSFQGRYLRAIPEWRVSNGIAL